MPWLLVSIFTKPLRECETDTASRRITHQRHIRTPHTRGKLTVNRNEELEDIINVVLRRVWIVRRNHSAVQRLNELRHQRPMLRSKAIDVRASMQIDDMLLTRILSRRNGPHKMSVDFSF